MILAPRSTTHSSSLIASLTIGSVMIGAENVVFGSDYPHIEGMAEPLTYVKDLDGLPHEDVAKVMGGNLADVMRIPFAA